METVLRCRLPVVTSTSWDHEVRLYRTAGDREIARRAAAELLDLALRPTAVSAATDEIAFGIVDVAAQRGIEIPDELSVVGLDDVPAAEPVGLTTVRRPGTEKGRTAGLPLLLEPAGDGSAPQVLMRYEVVVRRSTAPPD